MDAHSSSLFTSAVTIAELADGVAKLRREGATRKAAALEDWLRTVLHLYADRVLPLDIAVALATGPLLDKVRGLGQSPGFADAAIVATASVHGLTILTRNWRHFVHFGLEALDPYVALPSST